MPAYEIRPDESALHSAILAASSKVIAVDFSDGFPRVDCSEALTDAECITIKTLTTTRARSFEIIRESAPAFIRESIDAWDFRASMTITHEIPVVSSTDWQEVARVITTPGFFGSNPARFDVFLIGDVKATGIGAEIRITEERVEDGDVAILGTYTVPDTLDAWTLFRLDGFPVRLSTNRYRIEARTGTATAVSIIGFSLSLLETR